MILADYTCTSCGDTHERTVESPAPDEMPCEFCDAVAVWSPTPIRGSVRHAEVERGTVAKPDSPYYCDTRALGEGMPLKEWKEKRARYQQERRHREFKRGD